MSFKQVFLNLVSFEAKYYNVGLVRKPVESCLEIDFFQDIEWLHNLNQNTFVADPFPINFQEQKAIMVEEFDYCKKKGHISIIVEQGGLYKKPVKVIDNGLHMSFPFTFVDSNTLYCLPESYQSGKLILYRCESFPYQWEPVRIILEMPAIDASLWYDHSRWWLLYGLQDGTENSSLYMASAIDLLNDSFEPGDSLPVISNDLTSRNAGGIFRIGQNLYRPSQDCTEKYGGKLLINQISFFTETFTSTVERIVDPETLENAYPDGVHHIAGNGSTTCVDGRKIIRIYRRPKEVLKRLLDLILKKLFHH